VNHHAGRPSPVRVLVVGVGVLIIGVLVATIVRQAWQTNSAASRVVAHERAGVAYLHPLTAVVSALVQAQSVAVQGGTFDATGLNKAIAALGRADAAVGGTLGTTQRYTDLKAEVIGALAQPRRGEDAYITYTGLVTLALALERQVGDNSNLIHDADLDSFYLMDAAVIRLPLAMVYAGKTVDLVTLAGGRDLSGEDAVAAAVARYGVADAGEQITQGLAKSVDVTTRAELGANIAPQLDAFRSAVDSFAPPTMLATLAAGMDSDQLGPAARQVFATAVPLAHRLLYELDAVLATRQDDLAGSWQVTLWSVVGAGATTMLLLWFLVRAPATSRPRGLEDEVPGDQVGVATLTDARSLLEAGELAPAGRSVWGRSRERGDAR
jgi:hypothetical protein